MLKKYKAAGIQLSANQLKEIKGGASNDDSSLLPGCTTSADCFHACTGDMLEGYWCIKGQCRFGYCP